MKTILVTGGAGFIGSHLCEYLLDNGDKVICVDNLFTGSKENVVNLQNNEHFKFINHDVIEPLNITGIDQIYHLACPASPIHYQKNPIFTAKTNFLGTLNMLEVARKNNARLLLTSTSETYGDPLEHPQKESYRGNVNQTGPRACYDEGKRIAETLCYDYERHHNTEVRIARIFNTYGPKMDKDDGRVVSNFVIQALKNNDLTVYGDGSQTRSFCYVSDMVHGLYLLMNCATSQPVNLGNPNERTVKEIAEKVLTMTGSHSTIAYKTLPVDDPRKRKPDITVAQTILDWTPHVDLDTGLQRTIEWFKK